MSSLTFTEWVHKKLNSIKNTHAVAISGMQDSSRYLKIVI
jgi:hypothetical protein